MLNRIAARLLNRTRKNLLPNGAREAGSRAVHNCSFVAISRGRWLAIGLAVMLTCCADGPLGEPKGAGVCEIFATPALFSGHVVKLKANLEMGYHYTFLKDEHCPKIGIALLIRDAMRTRNDVKPLLKFTDALGVDAQSKHVKGTFVGQIQAHPGDIPAVEFDLLSVSSVEEDSGIRDEK